MSNVDVVALVAAGCVGLFGSIWLTFWKINRGRCYYFDAQDLIKYQDQGSRQLPQSAETGTFAENLKNYIDLTKLLITISAAAITFGGTTSVSKGIFARISRLPKSNWQQRESAGLAGGGGGIRTHETLSGLTVFKTVVFDRSTTPPQRAKARINDPAQN
jgi:hypothetical protein